MTMSDPIREALEPFAKWLSDVAEFDLDEIVADGGITAGMVIQQEARTVWLPRIKALSLLTTKASDDELVERVARAIAYVIARRHRGLEPSAAEIHDWLSDQRREEARAALSSMPTIADEGEQ
jgi:hypothetical protein